MTDFLETPARAAPRGTLVLAHGAGAPMDSAFMNRIAEDLADVGLAVLRFEFPYMAGRRTGGPKRPPPRAEALIESFAAAVAAADPATRAAPLLVGGKSLGGRVAALYAGSDLLDPAVAGIVCLGYPFHAPGKPEATRLGPIEESRLPLLVCQGERDSFGNRAEVEGYPLPAHAELLWLADGSHDLAPRGKAAATWAGNLRQAAAAVAAFADRLAGA